VRKQFHVAVCLAVGFALCGAGRASAQSNTATAATNAEILTALTIANDTPLEFGKIAADPAGAIGGTVVIAPADGARSKTGPVMLVTGTTPTAARFTVTGDSTYAFTVTNNTASSISVSDGTDTMTVDTWLLSPASGWTLSGGTLDVSVGGTLHVGAAQPKGSYTNASGVSLTVAYN
jgi:hypothetical protein